ncbi:MAG: T9SS type A sorting domain-containing protein [Cyclobacteriaceae bacterium]
MKKTILIVFVLGLCGQILAQNPNWTVDGASFDHSMTIVGTLKIGDEIASNEQDYVAAFVNDELRGVTQLQHEPTSNQYLAYLIVYANTVSEEITFKAYNQSADQVVDLLNTEIFKINEQIGHVASPYIWSNVLLNSEAELIDFSFDEQLAAATFRDDSVLLDLAYDANIESLTASFTISDGAKVYLDDILQVSGNTANDFSTSVIYEVVSEDGETSNEYLVLAQVINSTPTDISLSNTSISENNNAEDEVGSITITDDDASHTIELLEQGDHQYFSIESGKLVADSIFDYEVKDEFGITIKVTDGAAQSIEKEFAIHINDVNESPTGLQLSKDEFEENNTSSSFLATLSSDDEDLNDAMTYSLITGTDTFRISNDSLYAKASFNFEHKSLFTISVKVTDQGNNEYQDTFTITIQDINDAPSSISLSSNEVYENLPFGTVIGSLIASDEDADDKHTFELIEGENGDHNEWVLISGDELMVKEELDYEQLKTLSIRVAAIDKFDATLEQTFTINVLDVSDSPSDIVISNSSIQENATNQFVGTLSIGSFSSDEITFEVSTDQHFTVSGDTLIAKGSFNYEEQSLYHPIIIATDLNAKTYQDTLTISITDINDAPVNIQLSNTSVYENLPFGSLIGTLSTEDEDVEEKHTFTLTDGEGNDHNTLVLISDNELLLKESVDYEQIDSLSIRIAVTDKSDVSFEQILTIDIQDTNDSPTDLLLSNSSFPENTNGHFIGLLSVVDVDPTATIFGFIDGDNDNELFSISSDSLFSTAYFDFEKRNSFILDIVAHDIDSFATINRFNLTLTNVNEPPASFDMEYFHLLEHDTIGSFIGEVSASDPDSGDQLAYTLGADSALDNRLFKLVGSNLKGDSLFNYEERDSFYIQVIATDLAGLSITDTILIKVIDCNDAPTQLLLDSVMLLENMPVGSTIGWLSTLDEDVSDVHSYQLLDSVSSQSVLIQDNQIITLDMFDFESDDSLDLNIMSIDSEGQKIVERFVLGIQNVNEAPYVKNVSPSYNKLTDSDLRISIVDMFDDPDIGDSLTYHLELPDGLDIIQGISLTGHVIVVTENVGDITFALVATDLGGLSDSTEIVVKQEEQMDVLGLAESVSVNIYPNPTQDVINLKSEFALSSYISIYDLKGKRMKVDRLDDYSIDVSTLTPGLYHLVINHKALNQTIKFIKQ